MPLHKSKPLLAFCVVMLVSLAVAYVPAARLFSFAYHTGEQSYILLMPILVAGLIYRDRKRIFATQTSGFSAAVGIGVAVGAVLIAFAYLSSAGSDIQLAATAAGLGAIWVAGFMLCFGTAAARAAMFPLGMLAWIIPIPAAGIDGITVSLQRASTEAVDVLFRVTGVPVLREGFVFNLPGQSIEVARQCSGIRSSLSLIIITLILAHESLQSNWRRLILVLSTFPIVVLKNGVRIVTLTLLAIYVDPSFLSGSLHHDGGIVFFLIGLVMVMPVLTLLRRGEVSIEPAPPTRAEAAAVGGRG